MACMPRLAPAAALLATLLGAGCASNRTDPRKPPTPTLTLPAQASPQLSQAPAGAPPPSRPVMGTGRLMGRSEAAPVGTATHALQARPRAHKPAQRACPPGET